MMLGPSPLIGLRIAFLPDPYEIFVPSGEADSLSALPRAVVGAGTHAEVGVIEPEWTFLRGRHASA